MGWFYIFKHKAVEKVKVKVKLKWYKTCECCPEQWEVFDENGKHVAYVRLRWGRLTVKCPDVGGDLVYETNIGDGLTGCFRNEDEASKYRDIISDKIIEWMYRKPRKKLRDC